MPRAAPIDSREAHLHTARALLHAARVYREAGQSRSAATMLQWAANARKRAEDATPRDLFGRRAP